MQTSPNIDLQAAIGRLEQRLNFAVRTTGTDEACLIAHLAHWLADEAGTVPARQLAARAKAASRFLKVSRHV